MLCICWLAVALPRLMCPGALIYLLFRTSGFIPRNASQSGIVQSLVIFNCRYWKSLFLSSLCHTCITYTKFSIIFNFFNKFSNIDSKYRNAAYLCCASVWNNHAFDGIFEQEKVNFAIENCLYYVRFHQRRLIAALRKKQRAS